MKPQELRLNNWVLTKTAYDKPTEIQVHSIGANGINLRINSGLHENDIEPEIVFDDLEGIALTEKHLLAWGFEKNGCLWIWPKTMLVEIYNRAKLEGNTHFIAGRMEKDYFLAVSNKISFVHQLQNLFYDLTDTELSQV